MDDLVRKIVFEEAMAQTKLARDKMVKAWMDCGWDLSESEVSEMDKEMRRIGLMAERSAACTWSALSDAEDRCIFLQTQAFCNAKGITMIEGDGEDEDEEDDDGFDA